MKKELTCPKCGEKISIYANPAPTVDVIIHDPQRGVVIIKRNNAPHGYALPGGFLDEGEQAEAGAIREMKEETGLDVELTGLLGVYSRPDRDPRRHTMSTVFIGRAKNPEALQAGDDAGEAAWYKPGEYPQPIVFDHDQILADFEDVLKGRRQIAPIQPLAGK